MTAVHLSLSTTGVAVGVFGSPTVVGPTVFAGLVWATIGLVVAVFAYLLYGVVRAGGVELTGTGH
jgi:biopolymer transport protein ExbB/TolQ